MPYTTSDPTIATATREQLGAFILQSANAFPNLDTLSFSYRFGVAVGHAMLKSLNTKPGEPGFSQNFYRPTLSEYKSFNQILRKVAWESKKGDATSEKTNADFTRVFALAKTWHRGDAGIFAWLEKWCFEFWRPLTGVREDRGSWRDPFWLTFGAPNTNKPTGALAYVMSFVVIRSAFSNTVPSQWTEGKPLVELGSW